MTEKIKDLYYTAVSYLKTEKGQTITEYALVLVLIMLVVFFAFNTSSVESGISRASSRVGSSLP